MNLNSKQFHTMTRDEFEQQPGTFFHGNPTGNFNWESEGPQGFHVGTKQAATDAVVARSGTVDGSSGIGADHGGRGPTYSDGSAIPAPYKGTRRPVDDPDRPYTTSEFVAHPEHVRGGRITSPTVNAPGYMGSYGKGGSGDLHGSGDVMANGRVAAINTRGQKMRQGIFYKNQAEDSGSTSAVVPSRKDFKTHEDFLVEARAQGQSIPARALKGYSEVPGQQRLF